MAKIERKFMAHFINTDTTGSSPKYVRLGKDLEEYSPEMSAEVGTTKNILGESSINISSYEKTGSVEPYYAEKEDPLFERLQAIIDGNLVLDDLKTDVVEVKLWEAEQSGAYPAINAYGPINTLTLARLPQGDNVYREDADSVLNQGRIEIQIADNPFLDAIRDDVIDTMFSQIKGTIIQPYTLDWCADPALDPGDTITLTDTNNSTKVSLYGAESLDFDGGLRTSVELKSPSNETINYSQAASTKEILRRTRIQVDKVNQKIDFEASRTDGLTGNIAAIQLTTDQISQSVSSIQEDNNALKSRVATLENDSQSVSIKIQKIIDDGVDKVTTSTGYTFDEDGLHISKSGEEMENRLDNTGLYVERSGDIVLKANNEGVEAENVTVRTYLTVGKNSRFEDYDNGTRTGCFWVGR